MCNTIELKDVIKKGKTCLIIGNSKTGKTSLYNKVISDCKKEPIIISGNKETNIDNIWSLAIERVGGTKPFISSVQTKIDKEDNADIRVKAKIPLLGEMGGSFGGKGGSSITSEVSSQYITAKPDADHLIKCIKDTNKVLILEDLHYLNDKVRECIYQDCKKFISIEYPLLIICTAPHTYDILLGNKDLHGRYNKIEFESWNEDDLKQIIKQGFSHFSINIPVEIQNIISKESVGLPILPQAICHTLFSNKISTQLKVKLRKLEFTIEDTHNALVEVANSQYFNGSMLYKIIANNVKSEYYDIWIKILTAFAMDPLTFTLNINGLKNRLDKISFQKNSSKHSIDKINKSINAFNKLNIPEGSKIIEWNSLTNELNIIDPTFLFYLRWHEPRFKPSNHQLFAYDILERLSKLRQN